ncbi:hypothetical protein LZZ85_13720 [Terrimonas sp. NA20]|uniref:Macroglobulin domain-containing protein n=1 Tax=Terrimonas ginsenosidimutans TaxID=2908004 RepID=A0ABS9KSP2_9BACT|nr:hypothetical protein [Terrimonas ginsenosidimutans]MCG2615353.1 hypothetical protein [Terrimonas ginsenosidimutans]
MKNIRSSHFFPPVLFLLLISLFLTSIPAFSQDKNIFAFSSLAEKIYIQTDSRVYTNNKTIWFRAVVTDAVEHFPTKLSGVLYVELVDPSEKIMEKKLIRITEGVGDGFIELSADYPEGLYQLRAYTEWNKNFGADFIFREYLQVFASGNVVKVNPIRDITLVNEDNQHQYINALFDPLVIDSAHTKNLTLFVTLDDKKDTLVIGKNDKGNYLLKYPLPQDGQLVTLQLQTKNLRTYSRTILFAKNYLDLQFFPESGELIHGLPAVLGVKALDSSGKGKVIQGDIVNGKGEAVAHFKTNTFGMGTVTLPFADSTERYTAKVLNTGESASPARSFTLPRVSANGYVLNISKPADRILIRAYSNTGEDSVIVRASCRGLVYFDIRGRLKNGMLEFSLPTASLPDGVIAFAIMRDTSMPVAERLYFNSRPEHRLNLSLNTDKPNYQQREKSTLLIDTKNSEGKPTKASISVTVLNKDQLGDMQLNRQNIISYLLLSSDLKGTIEQPGYYFEKEQERSADLDALLLTQGWRKYNYVKPEETIRFQPEPFLTISGNVKGGLFGKKQKKGTSLTLMTFGKPPSVETTTSDSTGRFSFMINDLFQQTVNVLIQTNNKSGEKKDYMITLDQKQTPPVAFDQIRTVEQPDSTIQAFVRKSIDRKKTEDAYIAATEGVTLGEVIVKSYVLTPERKKVTDRYGKPSIIIEGDDIRANEAKWSYGLYSVLLFNYPDKIRIVRAGDGTLYAMHHNREMTLVVIDGIPVMPYDYPLIPSIPPSEVKTFEVIDFAKNFSTLYCELFPQSCMNAPAWGNVIAIYTYGKSGLFGANRAPGITKAAIPVFSPQRTFFAPKYEQPTADDWKKQDLRSLIHWAPNVQTDSTGRTSVSFYNADLTGKMLVIAEAISPNGEVGYQQLTFDVRRKEEQ